MTIPTFADVMKLTSQISCDEILQPAECEAMYDTLVQLPDGATVVEIGCDYGRSSSLIMQLAKAKNFLTIHIDPWRWHGDTDDHKQAAKAKHWMKLMCERLPYHPFILLRMTTEEAAPHVKRLTPGGIDFAFIDGSHDQDVVWKDLVIIAVRVNNNSFLTAHDYPSGGVTEALDSFVVQGWTKHTQAGGLGVWRRA